MKKLNELIDCPYDIMIHNVRSDSRQVKAGDLFVAVKGYRVNHSLYIRDAIARGAVAVVTEEKIKKDAIVIQVSDANRAYMDICSRFYNKKDWHLNLIGITGTDGKTTTATILSQLLGFSQRSAYIGTNGVTFQNQQYGTDNTTPLPELLYSYLDKLCQEKCQTVSLEVSSEALLHGRVDDLKFRYAILTNISEDHLDFHKTIENYVNAKAKLFSLLEDEGVAILNRDDAHFDEVYCKVKNKVVTYGVNYDADFQIKNVKFYPGLMKFDILHNDESFSIQSPLIGLYNAYNLTAAFIVCYLEKCNLSKVIQNISRLEMVAGRGEFLDFGQSYQVVLDYAHTTNGIQNILETLNHMPHKRIITVVGSAGGREKEKRASMGSVALEKSDFVIFTMDDPRYEKVSDIIDDLVSGSNKDNYIRIENRQEAIVKAFDMAEENDIVAILGKGRDHYMAVGDERLPYCDYDVIERYFE